MNLKYGTATIDEVGEAKFEIYEQELDIKSISRLDINAKYSDLEFGNAGTIDAIAYETDFIMHNREGYRMWHTSISEFFGLQFEMFFASFRH